MSEGEARALNTTKEVEDLKKILLILMIILTSFSLAACSTQEEHELPIRFYFDIAEEQRFWVIEDKECDLVSGECVVYSEAFYIISAFYIEYEGKYSTIYYWKNDELTNVRVKSKLIQLLEGSPWNMYWRYLYDKK